MAKSGIAGLVMMMMVVVVMMMSGRSEGAVYTVGETSGWSMGADYDTWAKDKTFAVGDTLVFNYPSGHNVEEVSADDYKSCTSGNAITSDSSGATSITLKTAGPHYYICGIPGHCDGGMKLAVTAAAAGAAPGGSNDAPPSTATGGSPPSKTTGGSPPSTTTASPAAPTGVTHTQPSSSAALSPSAACLFALFFATLKRFVM